jgi:hypothetical protein
LVARIRLDQSARHHHPKPDGTGPSWLTLLGHMKDSLWSVDLLRCESVALRTYWILLAMTNTLDGLSDLEFKLASSTVWRFAGCSNRRFEDKYSEVSEFRSRSAVPVSSVVWISFYSGTGRTWKCLEQSKFGSQRDSFSNRRIAYMRCWSEAQPR